MQRSMLKRYGLLLACLALAACRRDDIQTYIAPKEAPAMPGMAAMGGNSMPPVPSAAAGSARAIHWTTPDGWAEQPATSMRVGNFLIKGSNGKTAEMSVVPLEGDAGGDLANINRWRGQIQLPPLAEADLKTAASTQTFKGRAMRWVDFANAQHRITAAIYKTSTQTWFFKMTGDDATVQAAQPAFRTFLRSLRFDHA